MDCHRKTDLPLSREDHDHQTDEYENELGALVNNEPESPHLIDKVGSCESYLHVFLLPVYSSVILMIVFYHVTIVQVYGLSLVVLRQEFNILRILFDTFPLNHLFLDIDTDCEVHQVNYKLLPNLRGVDLKSNESQIHSDPKWQQIEDIVEVQALPDIGKCSKLKGYLDDKNKRRVPSD